MQALLIAGFATLAAAALPDKATLKSIFIDGQGTKTPGVLTQAQIDSIDRELTIEYDLPAFTMGSAMPSPFNDTCGLPTISCPAHKLSLTPGMYVSTIGVRGYAMTSASDYLTKVSPTITFDMNAGKKYTFLMFDAFSGAALWASGPFATMQQIMQYAVLNMDQSSGLSADLKTSYAPSLNFVAATPNIYAFTVWEHTQKATQPGDIGAFTAQKWIQAAGIADASLVAMNYYKCHGNVYSYAILKNGSHAPLVPTCTASTYSVGDKMCVTTDTTDVTTSEGSTTSSEPTSGSSITSSERALIFGIALAVTITRH